MNGCGASLSTLAAVPQFAGSRRAVRTLQTAGPHGYSSKTHRQLITRQWKGGSKGSTMTAVRRPARCRTRPGTNRTGDHLWHCSLATSSRTSRRTRPRAGSRFTSGCGDSWGVLFSHPKDFTPVCTTELGSMARLKPEFDKRNTKIIGLSVDPVENHARWADDIMDSQGHAPNFPMIGDTDPGDLQAVRHAADSQRRARPKAGPR